MEFQTNVSISDDGEFATVEINPDIFSLEVIYSAAYTFLDRAYFIFDGDPEETVKVKLKPKNDEIEVEELTKELQNELVNYAVYVIQASRNQGVRNAIIQRALNTNGVVYTDEESEEVEAGEADIIQDEEGIAETWSPEKSEGLEDMDLDGIAKSWTPDDMPDDLEEKEEEDDEYPVVGDKVKVDQSLCTNCGTCRTLAPESFELDENGRSKPVSQEIDENVKSAAETCPVNAIILEEE